MIFTNEQRQIIKCIKNGQNVFITGPGGTGKSTIIKHLIDINAQENQSFLGPDKTIGVTAMTGAAAVLINGQTLHSYLGIGLGKDSVDSLVRKIMMRPKIKKVWKNTNILIIDEVSMLTAELLTKLNNVAKEIKTDDRVFGGIQLVFSGDFLQLPCINGNFCFECEDWEECSFTVFHLTNILRQHDITFQKCLNNARFGKITADDLEYCSSNTLEKSNYSLEHVVKPTKILCHNANVNEINKKKLERLACKTLNEIKKYDAEIEYNSNFYDPHTHKFLFQDITKICNAQPTLFLTLGAQVMLLININTEKGLVNGSRGVIVSFTNEELPVVLFKNGMKLIIDYYKYEVTEGKNLIGMIIQIPLKLAYAITVHKSQGVTLDSAIIDLNGVFEYGQAYVALSRVKDVDSLFLFNAVVSSFKAHPKAIDFYKKLTHKTNT